MNPNTLSPDYIDDHLSVLSQKYCRFVLYYFEESPDETASIDDLAAYLRSREATDDDVARTLHHATLPALAAVGVIEYDARDETVRYCGHSTLEKWLSAVAGDERAIRRRGFDSAGRADADATDISDDAVLETYKPTQERTLTDAVLDAIEECKGADISYADFTLFDDIEPEALNTVFKDDAEPGTTLSFSTDGVTVELWGDGGVEIRVSK